MGMMGSSKAESFEGELFSSASKYCRYRACNFPLNYAANFCWYYYYKKTCWIVLEIIIGIIIMNACRGPGIMVIIHSSQLFTVKDIVTQLLLMVMITEVINFTCVDIASK